MNQSVKRRSTFWAAGLFGGLSLFAAAPAADAATLSLESFSRVSATGGAPINLTAVGDVDWAYWNNTGTGLTTPMAPSNEKVGGTIIGNIRTDDGTGNLRGSTSAVASTYSWTDGATTASGTGQSLALTFNNLIGSSNLNKGIGIDLPGSTTADRYAFLYFGNFSSTGRLTLTLPGATTITFNTPAYAGAPKANDIFVVKYRPDNVADQLSANYIMTATTDGTNGHVGAQAVAISSTPEPGTIGFLAVAGGLLALRRRRQDAVATPV